MEQKRVWKCPAGTPNATRVPMTVGFVETNLLRDGKDKGCDCTVASSSVMQAFVLSARKGNVLDVNA